jgi:hypothetical protein
MKAIPCLFCRLNEGHTVFVERKIAGRMLGENVRQMLAHDGWTELQGQVSVDSIESVMSFIELISLIM